jgi:uncharacterized protein YcfJ
MKTPITLVAALLMASSFIAHADELATVISSTPILEQVSVPATVCVNRQVTVQGEKSGGGALLGAVAGGAVGNAIGQGSGNALATAIGVIGGAMLGDSVEGPPATSTQTVQDCHQETRTETRTRAYRVVYEYAGKRYEIETAQPPGPTIPVRVSPAVPLSTAPSAVHIGSTNWVSTAERTQPRVKVRVSPVVISLGHYHASPPHHPHNRGQQPQEHRRWENRIEQRPYAGF